MGYQFKTSANTIIAFDWFYWILTAVKAPPFDDGTASEDADADADEDEHDDDSSKEDAADADETDDKDKDKDKDNKDDTQAAGSGDDAVSTAASSADGATPKSKAGFKRLFSKVGDGSAAKKQQRSVPKSSGSVVRPPAAPKKRGKGKGSK